MQNLGIIHDSKTVVERLLEFPHGCSNLGLSLTMQCWMQCQITLVTAVSNPINRRELCAVSKNNVAPLHHLFCQVGGDQAATTRVKIYGLVAISSISWHRSGSELSVNSAPEKRSLMRFA